MQGSALYEYSRATVGKIQAGGETKLENLTHANSVWCGDRRTVAGRDGPAFAGLEFGGFFGVPHRVSIKNQLAMDFSGVELGIAGGFSASSAHPLHMLREERQKTTQAV